MEVRRKGGSKEGSKDKEGSSQGGWIGEEGGVATAPLSESFCMIIKKKFTPILTVFPCSMALLAPLDHHPYLFF